MSFRVACSLLAFLVALNSCSGKQTPYSRSTETYTVSFGGAPVQTSVLFCTPSDPVESGHALLLFAAGGGLLGEDYTNLCEPLTAAGYVLGLINSTASSSQNVTLQTQEIVDLSRSIFDISRQKPIQRYLNSELLVGGHSMGGLSSSLAMTTQHAFPNMPDYTPVSNAKGLILMASAGRLRLQKGLGVEFPPFTGDIAIPTLYFTGTLECINTVTCGRQPGFDEMGSDCKILALVFGGNHRGWMNKTSTYPGLCSESDGLLPVRKQQELGGRLITDFIRQALKGESMLEELKRGEREGTWLFEYACTGVAYTSGGLSNEAKITEGANGVGSGLGGFGTCLCPRCCEAFSLVNRTCSV